MIEIKLDNTWIDISNQLLNQINYDSRADEVFDTGTFAFQSKTIDYNIPPHTLCRIDNKYWLCASECNKIIPTEYYNHDVSLLELTYIMHTVIIGTKMLSNNGNFKTLNDKLMILKDLANQKNKSMFNYDGDKYIIDYFPSDKNIEREFGFGAGTSLFQALLEIGKSADAIPRIAQLEEGTYNNTYHISWDYLDNNATFILQENQILGIKYFQDVENYTAVLEAEIKNVVDRDTVQTVNNLSVRSEEAIINSDNQVLLLPSKAEAITKFEVSTEFKISLFISGVPTSYFATLTNSPNDFLSFTWDELENDVTFKIVANEINNILSQKGISIPKTKIFNKQVDGSDSSLQNLFTFYPYGEFPKTHFNITSRVLEQAEWDLLEVSEKPKFAYYQTGSNVIQGLYERYKGDIWSDILKISSGPVLKDYFNNTLIFEESFNYGKYIKSSIYDEDRWYKDNPMEYTFNVQYTPIVDTFIKSDNVKTPFNENAIKHTSRSFEASASISDFNLLVESINKTNAMLGMPEITISYSGNTYPKPTDLIEIKGKNYYVSSVQTSILHGNYLSYINLVSSYSKIAEVFGVASQYESTRLPLTGIIDRIVYCGEYTNSKDATGITITQADGNTRIYKRGAKISYSNETYLIVEAIDNYTFTDAFVENENLTSGNYENKQYPYGNENNEQESYLVSTVKEGNLTVDESRKLPEITNYTLLMGQTITIHKDARERLIFVLKLI